MSESDKPQVEPQRSLPPPPRKPRTAIGVGDDDPRGRRNPRKRRPRRPRKTPPNP